MKIIPQNAKSSNSEYTLLAAWEQWKLGWDYFTANEPVTVCQSAQQRRGWWDALESEAAASLPANCADRLGF